MSDKQEYINIVNNKPEIPLFFKPWWLDTVCINSQWDVTLAKNKDGQLTGAFVYTISKKYGFLSRIHMPSLTPYLGLLEFPPSNITKRVSSYTFQKNTLENLANRLPQTHYFRINLSEDIKNVLALHWKGYKSSLRYTYILDIKENINDIYNNFKGSLRTDIKKANRLLKVKPLSDAETFFNINQNSFKRQGISIPYSQQLIKNIFSSCGKRDQLLCLQAIDNSGNIHGAVLVVMDCDKAYCIAIGAATNFRNSGAISLLLYQAILECKTKVSWFDFEGGNMPRTEKIFRAFGGELKPYISLYKSSNRILDTIFTLFGRS